MPHVSFFPEPMSIITDLTTAMLIESIIYTLCKLININYMIIIIIVICIYVFYLFYIYANKFIRSSKFIKIFKLIGSQKANKSVEENIETSEIAETSETSETLETAETLETLETQEYVELRKKIDTAIIEDLQFCDNEKMRKMLLYSLEGGKRVRTIIMLSLNPNIDIDKLLAIEYLHASSLIIDDIMDGDETRRGKKCLHMLYNNTMAQMSAIYLLSLSMNKSAKFGTIEDNKEYTKTFNELCIGQFMDVDNESYSIEKLMQYKTSVLFQLSYYLACPNENQRETYKKLGLLFGDIFQISDDYDDKGKDKEKNNIVLSKGKVESRKILNDTIINYKILAKETNIDNPLINHIINFLNQKTMN